MEILEAGLMAADPYHNTAIGEARWRPLTIWRETLQCRAHLKTDNEVIDLRTVERIFLLARARHPAVARALEDILGERVSGGYVIELGGWHAGTGARKWCGRTPCPTPDAPVAVAVSVNWQATSRSVTWESLRCAAMAFQPCSPSLLNRSALKNCGQ